MSNALANLQFKEGGGGDFIRFKAGETIKLRVFSTNPVVNIDNFGNTRYSFSVWNYNEDRAMILSATPSITKAIHQLHIDEDYDSDVTKLDIKINPTGDGLERRYSVQALPKAQKLTAEQEEAIKELDAKLGSIIKNGVRAEEYNNGKQPVSPEQDDAPPLTEADLPPEFR